MKVKDLIETLQNYDPNTRVVRPGYEGGYQDVTFISENDLALNVNKEWYYGAHELADDTDHYKKTYVIEKSILID